MKKKTKFSSKLFCNNVDYLGKKPQANKLNGAKSLNNSLLPQIKNILEMPNNAEKGGLTILTQINQRENG